MTRQTTARMRCWWAGTDPLYIRYHDEEWGRPVTEDVRLYEKICLEGFQAGLSWLTILRKRENFRAAFAGFDPSRVARFGARDVAGLLNNDGIVRHRGKIESAINNARQTIALQGEFGSLSNYIWQFLRYRRIFGSAAGPSLGRRRSTRSCKPSDS